MVDHRAPLVPRRDRIPFFAPAISPRLHRAWVTNLGAEGLGLTAQSSSASPVARGDQLSIDFPLGDTNRRIRATCEVVWASRPRDDGRFSLGGELRVISGEDRAALGLFIAQHRPRVLVALPSTEDLELVRLALPHLHLDALHDPLDLNLDGLHGYAAILIFARELSTTQSILRRLEKAHDQLDFHPLAPAILCTTLPPDVLLPWFDDGRIQRVLRPPVSPKELLTAVDRACERWALQAELRWASIQLEEAAPALAPGGPAAIAPRATIIRASPAMERVYELIHTVAAHDVPVLLLGETGTGKELAAREIHRQSRRSHTPYVAQDCGALTETLLESELFGHVRGAFTGATTDHPGLFQIADGGTIFLDEIQNTSPGLQAKLMRVVEEGEVRPVGSTKPRRVDVRLIAACNVDLGEAVRERRFRPDFFYRLNRFPIEIPPLREHAEDILPLVAHYLASISEALGRETPELDRADPRVERALLAHAWPGNIRELRNTIERAILLTPAGEPVRWESLPAIVRASADVSSPSERTLETRLQAYERQLIKDALDAHGGIIRRAAHELGVNPVTLARKLRRYGLP